MTAKSVSSVDTAGGDRGPQAIRAGLTKAARKNPDISFILHGDGDELVFNLRDGSRRLHRDAIIDIETVPIAQSPKLSWLRLVFEIDGTRRGVLVQSRDFADSADIRAATTRLRAMIVEWLAEPAMREMGLSRPASLDA